MSSGSFRADAVVTGRQSLNDELRTLIQSDRMDHLQRRLERGSLAVRQSACRNSGRNVCVSLDDDTVLVLRLFWARDRPLATLVSVAYDDRIGWVVAGRTTEGRPIVWYAWLATLHPPRPSP